MVGPAGVIPRYRLLQGPCGSPQGQQPPPGPQDIGSDCSLRAPPPGAKTLCARRVSSLPQRSQAIASSASAIRRSASVVPPHFPHVYSYTGMLHLDSEPRAIRRPSG